MFSKFCDQAQNRFIFPAISSIFICLFYYTDRWHYRLIFAGFFLFFLRKENKQIIGLSLICSTLVLFSCWLKKQNQSMIKGRWNVSWSPQTQ